MNVHRRNELISLYRPPATLYVITDRRSMATELQIESRTLSDITTRALQAQLNSTCFPAFGDAYVDHANVVCGPPAQTANAGAVQLLVPVDIFIALRAALLARRSS